MREAAFTALVVALGASCGPTGTTTYQPLRPVASEIPSAAASASSVADPTASAAPATTPGATCTELARGECMSSLRCTLVLLGAEEPEPYACRPAVGVCEDGLAQASTELASACTARAGCLAHPARCYCPCPEPRGCDCECAGGPPASCTAVGQAP